MKLIEGDDDDFGTFAPFEPIRPVEKLTVVGPGSDNSFVFSFVDNELSMFLLVFIVSVALVLYR